MPEETHEEWRERMRSIGQLGSGYKDSTHKRVVPRDADGSVAGTQTEHFDGRLDANVTPQPVVLIGNPNPKER